MQPSKSLGSEPGNIVLSDQGLLSMPSATTGILSADTLRAKFRPPIHSDWAMAEKRPNLHGSGSDPSVLRVRLCQVVVLLICDHWSSQNKEYAPFE